MRQKDRVQRACRNCHKRKIKCSGALPRCEYCEKYSRECVYDNTRRDRLAIATSHNGRLQSLLRGLSTRVSAQDKSLIDNALLDSEIDDDDSPLPGQCEPLSRVSTFQPPDDQASRSQTPSSAALFPLTTEGSWNGFTDDSIMEHSGRKDSYVSDRGFGKNPNAELALTCHIGEDAWLHDLQRRLVTHGRASHTSDAIGGLYLDSQGISLVDPGNPFTLPDEATTRVLFECYMTTVQRSFPFISIGLYRQVLAYYHSARNRQVVNISQTWYALVNLVLAIGARYSRYANTGRHLPPFDDAIFLSRAYQLLGFNETAIVLAEPDTLLIQATGLLAFYYMSVGYMNR